jgi:hypothetical protein
MLAFQTEGFLEERSIPGQFNQALKDGAVVSNDVPLNERVQKIRVMATIPIDGAH